MPTKRERVAERVSMRLGEKTYPLMTVHELDPAGMKIKQSGTPYLYYHPRQKEAWWVMKKDDLLKGQNYDGKDQIVSKLELVPGVQKVMVQDRKPPKGEGWIQVLPEHTSW